MAAIDDFISACSKLAGQHGIQLVVIAAADPVTQQPRVVASPGAMDSLRSTLAEKLKLVDPSSIEAETAWG